MAIHKPLYLKITESIEVDDSTGCWVWVKAIGADGYGRTSSGRKPHAKYMLAHRASYLVHIGEIPDGLCLDHLCRNRACVNPLHLEAVSHEENVLRGEAPGVVIWRNGKCPKCHEDLSIRGTKKNGRLRRYCKSCYNSRQREACRKYREAKRAKRLG